MNSEVGELEAQGLHLLQRLGFRSGVAFLSYLLIIVIRLLLSYLERLYLAGEAFEVYS